MPEKVNLRIFCKGVTIDERTKDYIEKRIEKIGKVLQNVREYNQEVEICLDKKGKFRVEIMINTPFRLYRNEETSESIEGSLDLALDGLKKQIIRDKNRMDELQKRGARSLKKKVVIDQNARF